MRNIYCIAQNFSGIKLWWCWNCKNIGRENFGSWQRQSPFNIFELTRPDNFLVDWQWTAKSAKVFSRQSFVLYSISQLIEKTCGTLIILNTLYKRSWIFKTPQLGPRKGVPHSKPLHNMYQNIMLCRNE